MCACLLIPAGGHDHRECILQTAQQHLRVLVVPFDFDTFAPSHMCMCTMLNILPYSCVQSASTFGMFFLNVCSSMCLMKQRNKTSIKTRVSDDCNMLCVLSVEEYTQRLRGILLLAGQ
jgi:hypothetical protein